MEGYYPNTLLEHIIRTEEERRNCPIRAENSLSARMKPDEFQRNFAFSTESRFNTTSFSVFYFRVFDLIPFKADIDYMFEVYFVKFSKKLFP